MTFPVWPSFDADEIDAVRQVMESGKVNYWTGNECRQFEREHAAMAGTHHAIAVSNGTMALELALVALGIGPGDEVVTTPRTFIATASCAVMRGARPVFADVDRDSQNITAATIERVLTPRTRAVIPVHLAGWPCEMDAIMDLARSRGIVVVEDCAQASGAAYRGRSVGGFGDAGAFSFCQDKIVTTGGEGGLLTVNDEATWSRAWSYKDHGKSYDAVYLREHPPGFRWLHESFGTNWRMTEVQAAIGRLQLRKLQGWVERRSANAALLRDALLNVPGLRIPCPPGDVRHAYYKFYCFIQPGALRAGWNRDRIMAAIVGSGVPCFSGSCSEIYLEKAFAASDLRPPARLPVARELGETSLMFLVHPTLGPQHMQRVIEAVRQVMSQAVL
ncbi:MAG: DegT/DnrJ/EryC1/StrS aminotransferase family protein [Gammaproteobacteria bacterium]|nr:DegT/DnrJ/EryC1/StrS aminotransferase family protein [Gammaproteobacteria bacterium]